MQILKLFVKASSGMPMTAAQTLQLIPGYGITGDLNAGMGNPRQVLIAEQRSIQEFNLQPGDLRENILIDGGLEPFVSGQVLQIGSALIRLMFRCEPCGYLEKLRIGLKKRIQARRGFLGMVIGGSTISINDPVTIAPYHFPPLTDQVKGRFQEFVARIPAGKVVTTADLILALGVSRAYYRTIPTWLKQALVDSESPLPVHRIVAIDGSLLTRHIPHQAEILATEGIHIFLGKVSNCDRWHRQYFHD